MPGEVVISEEILDRSEFSLLCNWRRLSRAVEIGVDRGDFALEFLRHWQGHLLFLIDPYLPYSEMPWDRDGDRLIALSRLSEYGQKIRPVRMASLDFAKALRGGVGPEYPLFFDFIYIDAQHTKFEVSRDIEAWWPFLSERGILSGHDHDSDHPGVVEAVSEFSFRENLTVRITQDFPPSWYIYKNEPGTDWKRLGPAPSVEG